MSSPGFVSEERAAVVLSGNKLNMRCPLRVCKSSYDVALPHWYRCVDDMLKLLISLRTQLRSGEMKHFVP